MEAAKTTINTQLSTVQAAFQTSINTVHTALLDSVWGFKDCATVIPDARLKTKFDAVAVEREGMVKELEVRGGATPSASGSVKGSLNRLWTKIKSSLSSGGIQHVLDDLAQEEADLKKLYETALSSEGIDSALNGVLNTHLKNIATHLSELRIICGEAKYSDKWDVSTPSTGEVLKDKLSTTGTTIKDTLTTTGQSISSAVATGGVALKDKLGYGTDTTATTTTTDTTTDTTSASTTGIKDKLVATGTVVKDNLVAAGTVIKDKFNEYTEGQDIKGQLAAAGTTIQGHLQTAGTAISTQLGNLSLGGQSQNPTGDKLTTELQKTTPVEKPAVTGTAGQEGTTGSDIKDKLQATGTYIKESLQAAGTAAGTALQSASATVQDKLGVQSQPTGEQLQDINATAAKLAQVNQEIHATVPTVPAATETTAPTSK